MKRPKRFRPYDVDQLLLLPPDLRGWLPEDDLAFFVMDVVERLDLQAIERTYEGWQGGQPAYHPQMLVSLLLYAYSTGVPSSRKIERATYHSVPFRVIAANQHPDHDTIAEFRRRHLKALEELFVQLLRICQKAGLVKLGHVALDGTKVRANASKHKAMSYGRMEKAAEQLQVEVQQLLEQAERVDTDEAGQGGDELPEALRRKQSRLEKIREAMSVLDAEAKAKAQARREELRQQEQTLEEQGKKRRGRPPQEPTDSPSAKAQRNFTDPDSRIMKDGATKSFEQCYNAQAAVDSASQIIVAAEVTQETNDKEQVVPMVEAIRANTEEQKPIHLSADAGYFSETNVEHLQEEGIDGYIATGRDKHGTPKPTAARGRIPRTATVKERMERKLRTLKGRATYSKRKGIVEPVFGQIKEVRGFRRFLLRGLGKVRAEWTLICLTHNLLKLFRSGLNPQVA